MPFPDTPERQEKLFFFLIPCTTCRKPATSYFSIFFDLESLNAPCQSQPFTTRWPAKLCFGSPSILPATSDYLRRRRIIVCTHLKGVGFGIAVASHVRERWTKHQNGSEELAAAAAAAAL